jgi:hypothetical protein
MLTLEGVLKLRWKIWGIAATSTLTLSQDSVALCYIPEETRVFAIFMP